MGEFTVNPTSNFVTNNNKPVNVQFTLRKGLLPLPFSDWWKRIKDANGNEAKNEHELNI